MKNIRKIIMTAIIVLLGIGLSTMNAQREYGDVGIGVQFGQPTGLTLKVYRPNASLDLLAAWDWDDFFFLNIHSIYDVHLNDQNTVHFFYGPGVFIGLRERSEINDEVELGVSGSLGLDFLIQKFEIFLQATPRLALLKSTDFDMGGGVGFRIYF
jgi:hypothetical protein